MTDQKTIDLNTIAELQQKVAEADALGDMKSNFLATMSHEIRTPMQSIYGLLELIGEEKPPEKIQTMVVTAQNAACGLLEILDDILDIAKMDADKMELDPFEVPVRMLVRGTLEALVVKVHGVNIDLVDDIQSDVPFVILGDPKRLRQIIMNLTGNGIKFTDHGSVTVRVTTNVQHITPKDGELGLRFEIIDTGIGMSQDVCDKLFGSFTQADSSTSRKYGGTGLGLNISKKLVELMGGEIGVFSTEGTGSTFWFEIPTSEVSTDENTVELPDLTGISILSVEDHPQGAKEIKNSLQSMGAKVESCGTCEEARSLVEKIPFDIAICDQGLPDGLGLDLIRDITNLRPNMGLVMYTVRDDIGLSHTLQALGVTYLTKPASRAGLGEAVLNATSKVTKLSSDGPRRLLIAEDTASVRDILQRQLDNLGVEADFAVNGIEALQALKTGKYGILFSDLHMPEMDGYTLVKTIREDVSDQENRFPVIALTADVQMAQRDTYMSHGFDECLLKPVSLGQIRRLLIRWGLLDEEAKADTPVTVTETEQPENAEASDDKPPAVDKDAIRSQMGALDENAVEMMGMFAEMTEPLIADLITAKDAQSQAGLREHAHSLKGGARSACCNVLGDIASELQDESENAKFRPDLVDDIAAEFERVKVAIAELQPD